MRYFFTARCSTERSYAILRLSVCLHVCLSQTDCLSVCLSVCLFMTLILPDHKKILSPGSFYWVVKKNRSVPRGSARNSSWNTRTGGVWQQDPCDSTAFLLNIVSLQNHSEKADCTTGPCNVYCVAVLKFGIFFTVCTLLGYCVSVLMITKLQ